ncbi:MAG: DNA mismatch repair protein MutS [Victivallaceae bacterium]|nr:DNA mismatch repair protein MutS [Victivallaceae bacterium]
MADEQLTPMMQQYRAAKMQIPADAVLLFRLGDFYEEFFEDAETVSRVLELVLTKRQNVPMCGFPHHALESYLPRLVGAGLKVAIADQMEDPKLAQGKIVKREITRIITPGTVTDDALLKFDRSNYLAALAVHPKTGRFALAALEVSTGEFFFVIPPDEARLVAELTRLGVREVLIGKKLGAKFRTENSFPDCGEKVLWTELEDFEFDFSVCERRLLAHFGVASLDGFGCREFPEAVSAAGAILAYAVDKLRRDAGHVRILEYRNLEKILELDPISLRNLELVNTRFDAGKTGSLLGVIDCCATSMGGRKLRNWVLRPLCDHDAIIARLDAVESFFLDPLTLAELRETLGIVRDLERITGRINIGSATPRDFVALAFSLETLPGIKTLLGDATVPLLLALREKLVDFSSLVGRLRATLEDEPPAILADGGVIRPGFNAALDELRSAATDGKSWLATIQQREIERTGIKSLKVKFNSVFGYYIEVSKSNLASVPDDYIRKQTLVNAERFITPELKELEGKILGAEERAKALEAKLFAELREFVLGYTAQIQNAADALSEIDALASLAETARVNRYVRPRIFDDDRLSITGGRHPVLEKILPEGRFVPNDTLLDGDFNRLMLITGPNMAGKSTYIRQVALIVVLAQIGSFVPAESAEIGLVDRIFTRIGAADDLSRSQSTFMVEMIETANILHHATPRSLVVLDEIGRGTSTFDGLSIAWSVAEYLHDDPRCRTLFATHYHELTELAETRRGVNNYNVAVREYGEEIIFLRQIVPGASDRSYGIHVARLAGLPRAVLDRAAAILELLEKNAAAPREAIASLPRQIVKGKRKSTREDDFVQLKLL